LFKVFKIFNGGRGYARRRGDALGSGRREGREGRWGAPPRRETKGGLPIREGRGLQQRSDRHQRGVQAIAGEE
jgi:hypothetical protein